MPAKRLIYIKKDDAFRYVSAVQKPKKSGKSGTGKKTIRWASCYKPQQPLYVEFSKTDLLAMQAEDLRPQSYIEFVKFDKPCKAKPFTPTRIKTTLGRGKPHPNRR